MALLSDDKCFVYSIEYDNHFGLRFEFLQINCLYIVEIYKYA